MGCPQTSSLEWHLARKEGAELRLILLLILDFGFHNSVDIFHPEGRSLLQIRNHVFVVAELGGNMVLKEEEPAIE